MFSLFGKDGRNYICIEFEELCGNGHKGNVLRCKLIIVAGSLGVNFDELFIYEGEIRSFLESINDIDNKSITMGIFTNEDLNFTVTPTKYGHMLVEGIFKQNNGKDYMCKFGFESDITCVESAKSEIIKFFKEVNG